MTSLRRALFLEPPVMALFLIIVIAAAAAFWIDGETGGEAQPSEPVLTRWGNVTVLAPPRETGVIVRRSTHDGEPFIDVVHRDLQVGIQIDATDGSVVSDTVALADIPTSVRDEFDAVLTSVTVQEALSLPDVWPYAGEPPKGEPFRVGRIEFTAPTAEAGFRVFVHDNGFFQLANSRSRLVIDSTTGDVHEQTSIDPVDAEAFDRLLDAVRVIPY